MVYKGFNQEINNNYTGHCHGRLGQESYGACLLYTSDAADDSLRVDLGGRRIIKKLF